MVISSAVDKSTMNKTRVKILIPNSKESVRLPNKNRALRHYTLEWLDREIKTVSKDYQIEVIELRNSKVSVDTSEDSRYSYDITPLYCPDEVSGEMRDLLAYEALHGVRADVSVLLQLTQPKRRLGLLQDAVKATLSSPDRLTASYTKQPIELWRVVSPGMTNWQEQIRGDDSLNCLAMYDGAIYGFTNAALLWQHDKPKTMIENYTGTLIDIDTLEDYKRFMITETDNYQATLREYESLMDDKKEYNETISYTDDEREYKDTDRLG